MFYFVFVCFIDSSQNMYTHIHTQTNIHIKTYKQNSNKKQIQSKQKLKLPKINVTNQRMKKLIRMNNVTVVRVKKLRGTMPKLILPANDALDDDELQELRKPIQRRAPISLSPSPSPIPPDDIDPEIDPDNVVVRGTYTDDDDDD